MVVDPDFNEWSKPLMEKARKCLIFSRKKIRANPNPQTGLCFTYSSTGRCVEWLRVFPIPWRAGLCILCHCAHFSCVHRMQCVWIVCAWCVHGLIPWLTPPYSSLSVSGYRDRILEHESVLDSINGPRLKPLH